LGIGNGPDKVKRKWCGKRAYAIAYGFFP